jgi:hypothetical protein
MAKANTPKTRKDKTMTLNSGNFRLVILLGKAEVPAHTGNISRDVARRLKKAYAVARPQVETRVRKATV